MGWCECVSPSLMSEGGQWGLLGTASLEATGISCHTFAFGFKPAPLEVTFKAETAPWDEFITVQHLKKKEKKDELHFWILAKSNIFKNTDSKTDNSLHVKAVNYPNQTAAVKRFIYRQTDLNVTDGFPSAIEMHTVLSIMYLIFSLIHLRLAISYLLGITLIPRLLSKSEPVKLVWRDLKHPAVNCMFYDRAAEPPTLINLTTTQWVASYIQYWASRVFNALIKPNSCLI